MIDLDILEALARAATPGPWEPYESSRACEYISQVWCQAESDNERVVCYMNEAQRELANTAHIAAANPAAVLELCAELRKARALAIALGYQLQCYLAAEETEWCPRRMREPPFNWRVTLGDWAEGGEG